MSPETWLTFPTARAPFVLSRPDYVGQLKEVRNRIKSVQSTQQITKAMKMVSAAKLRRAQGRHPQMRPYAIKLSDLLSNIVSGAGSAELPLAAERAPERILLIPITSDRGLAGAYNTNIIKLTRELSVSATLRSTVRATLPSCPWARSPMSTSHGWATIWTSVSGGC
jgi:hypothetical protein